MITKRPSDDADEPDSSPSDADALSYGDGEIHFFWHFMQGSIMYPDTRWRLRHHRGFCERHSFAWLAVESAFRPHFLHGPAILYTDLMERARSVVRMHGPLRRLRVRRGLRETGPCLMCEIGYTPGSKRSAGMARPELIAIGRDLLPVTELVRSTESSWQRWVCGRCAGTSAVPRCRSHLREELLRGNVQLALVEEVAGHAARFEHSFVWGYQGTEIAEDHTASSAPSAGAAAGGPGWR